MAKWKQRVTRGVVIVGGLALVGLGAYFVVVGLDRADKLASVIGVFVGLVGSGFSGYSVVLTRRGPAQSPSRGQTVSRSAVAGDVLQIRDVGGDVRIGPAVAGTAAEAPRTRIPRFMPAQDARTCGDQLVTETQVQGQVRHVDGIGGAVEVDR
jgi:hypothetical protein